MEKVAPPRSQAQGEAFFALARRARTLSYALRAQVRGSEVGLTLLALAIGILGGAVVAQIIHIATWMHTTLFGINVGTRITNPFNASLYSWAFIPMVGGLVLAGGTWLVQRWRKGQVVDPIEANALHGGQMSLRDSAWVTAQTMVSNGFGASVGLEAGYTQICSAVASKLGVWFKLRRQDLRVLVAAGAAAGIAAAFGAPLTGAFYGFEIILGAYSISAAAPVLVAAVAGSLTAKALGAVSVPIALPATTPTEPLDYILFVLMGFVCGLIGIAVMRSVELVETGFRLSRIPALLRPALGGLAVGMLALITPQVLWEGHAAMHADILQDLALWALLVLFLFKATATVVSLGSGFRGGLFFASLFLGALLGKMLAGTAELFSAHVVADPVTAAVVGMSALAVAIIGGPLTMTFLALEMTGDFVITGIVLAAAVFASMTVRELFGYSFSTWRMHLRGETIRSAHDVGLLRGLTVGKVMQANVPMVPDDISLAELRRQYPIGSARRAVAVDEHERYVGMILMVDVYGPAHEKAEGNVHGLLKFQDAVLTAGMNVKSALALFDAREAEALVVVDNADNRKVVGLVSEAYALRRYSAELERSRRALAGEK